MLNPRLSAITGPVQGALFLLTAEELWVGRDPSNTIYLSDPLVSRRHCAITQEGDRFVVRDNNSSNGTLVNDVPVRDRHLAEGDRLQVGSSIFFFSLEETETKRPTIDAAFFGAEALTGTTITIRPEDDYYFHADKLPVGNLQAERLTKNLNALLNLSTIINQVRDPAQLPTRILQAIFEITPAERGAIILSREVFDKPDLITWLNRAGESAQPFRLSQTVIQRVRQEKMSLLSNEVTNDQTFNRVSSLIASATRSLLAVPLPLYDRTLGVIYLEASESELPFDEDHLQLVTAIARISSFAFDNLLWIARLEDENLRLRQEIQLEYEMVGESAAMQAIHQMLRKVAPTDSTVLLLGESGTGKELAARALHQLSPRANKPFVAINCAGLSDTLLESDLFGHEKGAFTGAVAQKKGKMELADGGTLFLDEIGELPVELQAKLLRALQTREFERVGGTRTIKTDLRLVAATNRNLEAAIKSGGFRSDLYYRLNVISLTMPALRERRDDISLLAHYFVMKYAQKCKRPLKGITAEARQLLGAYDWPGNVRELENVIERAIVLGSTEMIRPEDLPETINELFLPAEITVSNYHRATKDAKKQLILQTLEKTQNNYTEAAKLLGIHRNNLHRLIRNLGIKDEISG